MDSIYSPDSMKYATRAASKLRFEKGAPRWDSVVSTVFDTLDRSPWWEEVTDSNTVIQAGRAVRIEGSLNILKSVSVHVIPSYYSAVEVIYPCPVSVDTLSSVDPDLRFFVDTRWVPRPVPLSGSLGVGDPLTSVRQARSLPDGTGLVDTDGDLWSIFGGNPYPCDPGGGFTRPWTRHLLDTFKFRIIHIGDQS